MILNEGEKAETLETNIIKLNCVTKSILKHWNWKSKSFLKNEPI